MSMIKPTILALFLMISVTLLGPRVLHAHDLVQRYVAAHNAARAEVGVGPVVWNQTIANFARGYAKKLASNCEVFEHSGVEEYGECLVEGGAPMTPEQAVGYWVDEKKNYDHGQNTCVGGECGHYTQVVWTSTCEIGCAQEKCAKPEGWYVATCNYYPPGNYVGDSPY